MTFVLFGLIATIIGFILVTYGPNMAVLHPRHSALTYRLSGVICFIAAGICMANAF